MNFGYQKKYQLSISDVDMYDRIKPAAILNFFQDIATENADLMELGREGMNKLNSFWIVSRTSFLIKKPLAFSDKINIRTWVSSVKLIHSDRDYIIYDKTGDIAVVGSSKWCIIDKLTHGIKKIGDIFPSSIINPEKHIDTQKIDIPDRPPDYMDKYIVRPNDIDVNLHMNNAKYADMIFNALTMEEHGRNFMQEFHINYLNEIKVGESVIIRRWNNQDGISVEGAGAAVFFRAMVKLADA